MKKLCALFLAFTVVFITLSLSACNTPTTQTSSSSQIMYQTKSVSKSSSSQASVDSVDTSESVSESESTSESVIDSSSEDISKVTELIGLINAIGEINMYNYTQKLIEIENCEEKYSQLESNQISSITNYPSLVKARNDYNACKNQAEADALLVLAFTNKVSEIENFVFNTEYKDKLDAADSAYNSLPDYTKQTETVEASLLILNARKSEYALAVIDALPKEVKDAIILIDAIGTVTSSNFASKLSAIEAAENAYNLVSSGDKASVTNYNLLQTARQNYNQFYQAEQTILLAIDDFKTKVSEIEMFEFTSSYKILLDAAVSAYNIIPTERRNEVSTEKATLDARNQTYSEHLAVTDFISAFNALPNEEITKLNSSAFKAVVATYDGFNAFQKSLVSSAIVSALDGFRATLSTLPSESFVYDFNSMSGTVGSPLYFGGNLSTYGTTSSSGSHTVTCSSLTKQSVSGIQFANGSAGVQAIARTKDISNGFLITLNLTEDANVTIYYGRGSGTNSGSGFYDVVANSKNHAYILNSDTSNVYYPRAATNQEVTAHNLKVAAIDLSLSSGITTIDLASSVANSSRVFLFRIVLEY